jgi:hypothetical protein
MSEGIEFVPFRKIPRLSREITITEKIDGTNGVIWVNETGDDILVGSRTRWITPEQDNAGFARWAYEHKQELLTLGPGFHYGEWWGQGIQRNYGLKEKRFSLFNVFKWGDDFIRPACCSVVPVLYRGMFETMVIDCMLSNLAMHGSYAAPGFMNPEGVVIYHTASGQYFKKTIINDEKPKGSTE